MRPGMGRFAPGYTDELYGGGYPNRGGVRGSAGRPGGYGRNYPTGSPDRASASRGYGRDYRAGGYPEHRGAASGRYGRDYPDRGYGWDYQAGSNAGRQRFGGRREAEGYRGPGTDLGEDIARGYVGRWRDPRPGFRRGPGSPGRGRW